MKNTTILNNMAECDCMLNEDKKECNESLQDGTKKSSENEIALRFTNNENSENSEAEVSLNLFNKESNDNKESKMLTNDHKKSCERGCQEIGLNDVTEGLEDNTLGDDTQTIDLTNTKEKLGDSIKNATTQTITTTSTKEKLENDTNNTAPATDLTAQIEDSATKTNLIIQPENATTKTDSVTKNDCVSSQATSKENAPLNDLAEKVSKERELDRRVMDILLAIGISANLHGYYFLKDSIKLAISSPVFIGAITETMYPTIATMHQTTAFRVERAMRHAIDVSYNKGKIPCLNQIFSLDIFSSYDKPTNAEFIALIADELKQEFCC